MQKLTSKCGHPVSTAVVVGIVLCLAFCGAADASLFYPIAGVASDTAGTDFYPVSRLIEGPGVGFDAAEPHNRTSSLTWVTNAPNGGAGDYFNPTPVPGPRLVFDLGADVLLHEISVWGYADTNANGARQFGLRFATAADGTGGFGTSIPLNPSFTSIQAVTPRQSFLFPNVSARYVELVPTDNFFGINPPGGDRVGLGEVAFALPEATVPYVESFDAGAGAFSVVNTGNPEGPWTYDGAGTWYTNGSENLGRPSHSRLTSPPITVTTADPLQLTFDHRYSIEGDLWDGAAVFLSVNGAPYAQILNADFIQNGYTGFGLIGNHDLNGGEGYNGDSPGYNLREFITSIVDLGPFNVGDTLSVQFLAAWDEFAKGTEPNWQIDSLRIAPAPADVIPEPATLSLLGLGLLAVARRRRKR